MTQSKRIKAQMDKILPNPANLKNQSYIKDKIEYLKSTIQDTKFWNSIPAREVEIDGEIFYEIGCGHHRIEALKELGHSTVILEVEERTDIEMIKILFQENMNNSRHPKQVNNSVWGTQDFLNEKFSNIKTLEDYKKTNWYSVIPVDSENEFKAIKRDGVIAKHIHMIVKEFWPLRTIQESLKYRGNNKISPKAMDLFNSQHQLDLFNGKINQYGIENHSEQLEIARKIMKGDKFSNKVMDDIFKNKLKKRSSSQIVKDKSARSKPSISETMAECISQQSEVNSKLLQLMGYSDQINSHDFIEYMNRFQRLVSILMGSDKINTLKQLVGPENTNLIEGEKK